MTGRGRTPGPLRAVRSLQLCRSRKRSDLAFGVMLSPSHVCSKVSPDRSPPSGGSACPLSVSLRRGDAHHPVPPGPPVPGRECVSWGGGVGGAGPCLPRVRVFGTPRDRWRRALPRARPQRQPSSQRHVFIIAKAESVYLEFSQERASPPTVLESLTAL